MRKSVTITETTHRRLKIASMRIPIPMETLADKVLSAWLDKTQPNEPETTPDGILFNDLLK